MRFILAAAIVPFSLAAMLPGTAARAAPALALSSTTGHPQDSTRLSGSSFAANEAVDIYFDSTDVLLEVSDAAGKFGPDKIAIPANALPGDHWITAIGRKNGDAGHRKFVVSTAWVSHGFNARGRRRNPYENVLNITVANRLDLTWSAVTGAPVVSSPAVSQVGASYSPRIFVGSRDGSLYAFDNTGALKWSKPTGDSIESSPTVDGTNVYVGSEDDKLYAFRTANGNPAWSSPANAGGSVDSAPAVANGVVYVGVSNGTVAAFKTVDGSAAWPSPVNTGGTIPSSPAVADGIVYVGAMDGKVYALKAADGSAAWPSPATTGAAIVSSPAVANGIVYIGSRDDKVYALNAKTGAAVWPAPAITGGFVDSSPAIANGVVYVASVDGKVYALNANTGAIIWTGTAGPFNGISSPAVANNTVFVGSGDGRLYAFSTTCASTCLPTWSAATGSAITSSPAVSDGMVFVGSLDGSLYAFALDAGNNAVYRQRHAAAPSYASLHPDFRLKPVRHASGLQ